MQKLPRYDPDSIRHAHEWHRIMLERQAIADNHGAAEAATFAMVLASTADPRRERTEFDKLRLDCLAVQRAWFRPYSRPSFV